MDDDIFAIDFPKEKQNLKFDTIEAFIRNNDYKDKDAWDSNIVREYLAIEDTGYFPQSLLEVFEEAASELQKEFTLDNIKEIKKLVSGNAN